MRCQPGPCASDRPDRTARRLCLIRYDPVTPQVRGMATLPDRIGRACDPSSAGCMLERTATCPSWYCPAVVGRATRTGGIRDELGEGANVQAVPGVRADRGAAGAIGLLVLLLFGAALVAGALLGQAVAGAQEPAGQAATSAGARPLTGSPAAAPSARTRR